jgi:hypothetical protein
MHHFGAAMHHRGAGAKPAAPVQKLVQILECGGHVQVYSVKATVSSVNLTLAWINHEKYTVEAAG